MSDLRHHSMQPITLESLKPREQEEGIKPEGLWVSVGSEWQDWCEENHFRAGEQEQVYQVTLAQDAQILTIDSVGQLDSFTMSYRAQAHWSQTTYLIDWAAVARLYDGILISPYQWSRRLTEHSRWYYGWDCASGCIWNPAAVDSLKPINQS